MVLIFWGSQTPELSPCGPRAPRCFSARRSRYGGGGELPTGGPSLGPGAPPAPPRTEPAAELRPATYRGH